MQERELLKKLNLNEVLIEDLDLDKGIGLTLFQKTLIIFWHNNTISKVSSLSSDFKSFLLCSTLHFSNLQIYLYSTQVCEPKHKHLLRDLIPLIWKFKRVVEFWSNCVVNHTTHSADQH